MQEIIDNIRYVQAKFAQLDEVEETAYDKAVKYIEDLYDDNYNWPVPYITSGCAYGVSFVWEIGDIWLDIEIMPEGIGNFGVYVAGDNSPIFVDPEKLGQIRLILNNATRLDKQD